MGNKKFVLNDLRISYNGPIDIKEFMAEVEKWLNGHGYEKEPKKYSEHLTKEGKQVEWVIEAHKGFSKLYRGTIRLKALFNNLKGSVLPTKNKKLRITSADVLVYIDGIIEEEITESYYHTKPMYQFITTIIDKYIYKFWSDKYDGNVIGDGHSLLKQLRAFFSLQKYKWQ